MPDVLQVLRLVSVAVLVSRRPARRRRSGRHRCRDGPSHGSVLPVQALRGAVPVHGARQPRVPVGLPQAGPSLQGPACQSRGARATGPGAGRSGPDGDPCPCIRWSGQRGQHTQSDPPDLPGEGAGRPPRQGPPPLRPNHLHRLGHSTRPRQRRSDRRRSRPLPDLLRGAQRTRGRARHGRCAGTQRRGPDM